MYDWLTYLHNLAGSYCTQRKHCASLQAYGLTFWRDKERKKTVFNESGDVSEATTSTLLRQMDLATMITKMAMMFKRLMHTE